MDDALRPTKSCETESINGCIVERYHAIAAAAQVKRQADNSTSRGVRFTCCSMSMSRCTLMSGLCCMLDPVDDARRSTPRGAWWMVDRNTHNPRDPRRGTLSSSTHHRCTEVILRLLSGEAAFTHSHSTGHGRETPVSRPSVYTISIRPVSHLLHILRDCGRF